MLGETGSLLWTAGGVVETVAVLTTEALSRPIDGNSPALHIPASQSVTRYSGLVALLTSVRPLPQAEDDTSQRMAKAAVITRS